MPSRWVGEYRRIAIKVADFRGNEVVSVIHPSSGVINCES